jgi:hypothetical protein
MEIRTVSGVLTVSDELVRDAAAFRRAFDSAMTATPEQRNEWAIRAKAERKAEREAAEHVTPSLAALAEKFGWSESYIEHLCQPYCGCYVGADGWEYCLHVDDLDLNA